MRGYRSLKNAGQLNSVAFIKQVLTIENLRIKNDRFSESLYGVSGFQDAEIITRQYLLARVGGLSLNKALLYSKGKQNGSVIYPLPKVWREIIKSHDFRVSNFWCAFLWQVTVFLYFGYGVLTILKIAFQEIQEKKSPDNFGKYVYFNGLAEGNFPITSGGNKNIFSWYSQWQGRKENIQILRHSVSNRKSRFTIGNVGVEFQKSPIPSLPSFVSRLKYLLWGLQISLIAFLDIFRGRWWHAFLLNQAATMGQVTHIKPHLLASEYLFHNSGWIYRPLWTYEAESRGSTISFYFYATNCENFMQPNRETDIPYGWRAISWPRYLVWDAWQAKFIKEAVGANTDISIVGDIWFNGSDSAYLKMQSRSIAVFDVQPYRESFYQHLGLSLEYYTAKNSCKFLKDIYQVLKSENYNLILKRKREIGKLMHPKYRTFIKELNDLPSFKEVESTTDPAILIENCAAVISMPFTSTALLGRFKGVPSVYYDSTGMIEEDDPAAHGIQIIKTPSELTAWIHALDVQDVCN